MPKLEAATLERRKLEIARSAQAEDVLTGRVLLSNGDEYSCIARNVSIQSAELTVASTISTGQVVVCYFDQVGILPGRAIATTSTGFVVAFQIKPTRRDRITAQLEWWTKTRNEATELRRAPRIVPLHKDVEVRLGEQIVLAGTVLNISMSGAAIRLGTRDGPFVGARVRVGERFATVVRLLDDGIAVQFITPFTSENFDERVKL